MTGSRAVFGILVVVVFGLWAYLPTLAGPYLSDDYYLLCRLVDERGEPRFSEMAASYVAQQPGVDETLFFRPVHELSYFVDLVVFGVDPFWSRLLNVSIHLCCAVLLYRLFSRLLENRLVAWVGAALFAILPNNEPAVWVGARGDSLALFFALAALNSYLTGLRGGRLGWRLGRTAFFVLLSLMSKEPAIVVVPALLAMHWWFGGPSESPFPVRVLATMRAGAWIVALLVAFLLFRWYVLGAFVGGYTKMQQTPLFHAEFFQQKAFLLGVLWLPLRVVWAEGSDPRVIGGVAAGLIALLLALSAKDGSRIARGCWWTVVWLAASLFVVHALEWNPERRGTHRFVYQASAAWCMLLSVGASLVLARSGRARLALASIAAAGLLLSAWVDLTGRVGGYAEAHEEATQLLAQVRETYFDGREGPLVLHGLPDTRNGVMVARQVFPYALKPPFVERGLPREVLSLTDGLVRSGLGGWVAWEHVLFPGAVFAGWDAEQRRLVEGVMPDFPARLVGRLEFGSDGGWRLQPGDLELSHAGDWPESPDGRFVEVDGALVSRGGRAIEVTQVVDSSPGLQRSSDAAQACEITISGRPGAGVHLLLGGSSTLLPLGLAGTLRVEAPRFLRIEDIPASGQRRLNLCELLATSAEMPRFCQLVIQDESGRPMFRDLIELSR